MFENQDWKVVMIEHILHIVHLRRYRLIQILENIQIIRIIIVIDRQPEKLFLVITRPIQRSIFLHQKNDEHLILLIYHDHNQEKILSSESLREEKECTGCSDQYLYD